MDWKPQTFYYNRIQLAPSEQIGLHSQVGWELSYVITGRGMRLIGNTSEAFAAGEVILIPPGMPHCWYFDADEHNPQGKIENITLAFDRELIDKLVELFPEFTQVGEKMINRTEALAFTGNKRTELVALLVQMDTEPPAARIITLMRLLLLIADDEKETVVAHQTLISKTQGKLQQIKTYVICNAKHDISIDAISSHVGMSRTAFCIFFKKQTGKTFVAYVNEFRVMSACQQLAQSPESIADVCYSVGFNDIPYFNRVFKKIKGCSPTEYLKNHHK